MRTCIVAGLILVLTSIGLAQQPSSQEKMSDGKGSSHASARTDLKDILESKVKKEWEALRTRDKKAYGDLLAEDFVGVVNDGQGARGKTKAANELISETLKKCTLFGFAVVPLASDAAFVTYESTMEFPPKSTVRFARVYVSELWLQRDGQWRLRHYQETHVR
jgi:uncharacterized protein (TIGR02246 family)